MQVRLEAAQTELFVEGSVAAHEFCFAAIFQGLSEYGVGLILVEYHEVVFAFAGCGGETTGLVSGDFPAYFYGFHEDPIGSDARLVG